MFSPKLEIAQGRKSSALVINEVQELIVSDIVSCTAAVLITGVQGKAVPSNSNPNSDEPTGAEGSPQTPVTLVGSSQCQIFLSRGIFPVSCKDPSFLISKLKK